MKTRYRVKFWSSSNGEKPVAKWMKSLENSDREYLADLLRELAIDGPYYRHKVFKHLEAELWEVRDLRSPGSGYRIYFGFDGQFICLVVASGSKKSKNRDIKTAKKRLKMENK